jgi:choline-sulfatase
VRRAAAVAVLCLGACRPAPPPVARNLVLVTIDTLRADRLGCYGNRDVATPNLDRIADEGVLAPEAAVHVPLTRPSHVCLMTGLYPADSGIRDNVSPELRPDVPTLAELLRAQGFRTAGFVSSIVLSAQSGLNRGFEKYGDAFDAGADDARFLNTIQKRGDVTTGEALAWLRSRPEGRSFLWLHLYDPHDPYEPPEPYASRYAGRPYDGEVAYADEQVGRLQAELLRLGMQRDTLLIVTSDHGEGLGEHGENVHGFFVYQSTLHVPFLARGPGIAPGTRLAVTARSVDVLPTALELLGVPRPAGLKLRGRSLAGALSGRERPAEAASYAEALLPLLHYGWSDLRSLREGRWKYVEAPRPELYDLQQDPGESHDLAGTEPGRAEALRAALMLQMQEERTAAVAPSSAAGVPPDLLEKLGALGYLGAGAPRSGEGSGADPKDKIEEFKVLNRLVREGLTKLRAGDNPGAALSLSELLRRGISSFEVHYYLGRALVGEGKPREAASHFEIATARLPGFSAAYLALADCRIALGDLSQALSALERGLAASPRDARLFERQAQVLRKLGRGREAEAAYESATLLAPKDALLRVQMGELQRDLGNMGKAVAALQHAVELDPKTASYWNSLGMVLGGNAQLLEAEKAFREAMSRDARDPEYAYNLGLALQRQGRRQEAAEMFRKTLELDSHFRAARQRLAELTG